jgi:MFS family permease
MKRMTRRRPLYLNKNLLIITGITMMAVMGVASITPAFPSIAEHFQINYKKIGLLITAFTLPGIFLTPVLGVLADRFGRKAVLVPALFLFALAGFSCSLTEDFGTLVILRFIQGIGGASLGSLNVTLIGDIFKPEERAAAMGYNASVLSFATAAYPVVGGALTMIAWNFPFYFPLMAIPCGLMVLFALDSPRLKPAEKFFEYLRQTLRSVARREVLALFLLNIFTFIVLYGSFLTYFPYIMEHRFNSSAFVIGLIMSVSSLVTAITATQLGRLSRHYGQVNLLKVSYVCYFISLCLIPFLGSEAWMFLPAVFFGFAQGINIPNIQVLLVGFAPMQHRGAFMSLNGMVLRIGQTLGPLVAGVFFMLGGIRLAFLGGAFLAVVMILIVVAFCKQVNPSH